MRTDEAQKTCEKQNHFDKEEQYTVKVAPQDMHEKACTGETLKKKCRIFFLQTLKIDRSGGEARCHLYSSLPFPPAHKYPDTYFQLSIWDEYHIF